MTASTPDQPEPDALDSGLECPRCAYNLTGLTEQRCPECGSEFDLSELRRLADPQTVRATAWDIHRSVETFWATWRLAAFQPDQLARRFPRRHDAENASLYSWTCYALASAVFVGLALLAGLQGGASCVAIGVGVGVSVGVVFGAWVCENLLAACLSRLVPPTNAPEPFHFWRGLTHYTSGFLIVSAAWYGLAGVISVASFAVSGLFPTLVCAAVLGIITYVWWCVALWSAIWERKLPQSPHLLAYTAVPLIGVAAIAVACFASYLLAMFFALIAEALQA